MTEATNETFTRLADKQWETVQKKTFTKWVNTKLQQRNVQVQDITTELESGVPLLHLLEIIGDASIKFNSNPKLRIQKAENLNKALDFIKSRGVPITNIGAEDILDGNGKLILGLIWIIILRFTIAEISEGDLSAKEGLLLWCQRKTQGYNGVSVKDFTFSWQDGLALCALIHKHRPDLIDFESLDKNNKAKNVEIAFEIAEKHLGIPRLLDVEDLVDILKPDERSVMTYVAQYFHAFSTAGKYEAAARRVNKFSQVISSVWSLQNDYEKRASEFISSIKETIESWNEAKFDGSYSDAKSHFQALAFFKKNLKRSLVAEKRNLDTLLGDINTKLNTYNLRAYKPPVGLEFADIEKSWNDLISAEISRSKEINNKIGQIKEQLRTDFATLANNFESELNGISAELANLEGDLNLQLSKTKALVTKIDSLENGIPALKALDSQLLEANIEENDYTVFSVDDILFDLKILQQSLLKKTAFIENQIVARGLTNVTPQQLEEFESTFHHFDKDNSNSLSRLEFKAAVAALGLVIEEENFEKVFISASKSSDQRSFENFVNYVVNQIEDKTSIEQLKESFRLLANNKESVTERDLVVGQVDEASVKFLRTLIKENELDYNQFLDQIFSQ